MMHSQTAQAQERAVSEHPSYVMFIMRPSAAWMISKEESASSRVWCFFCKRKEEVVVSGKKIEIVEAHAMLHI
jgi:hypothetical protein